MEHLYFTSGGVKLDLTEHEDISGTLRLYLNFSHMLSPFSLLPLASFISLKQLICQQISRSSTALLSLFLNLSALI